ncbi:(5-formylfuran-3-yl)methyl phosphate synthase [Blastopirellula marina]|uniref:(5-formylfuran-3-yl)methyl phosphate synthase n=1 Tax=Blastopirellula marina TaxID=124 RepID=A0A2S8GJQ2_9BACT|nr:(5-formylfuran-3-yl)methyl phosphate synthase [Blastopirellula marina]PQO44669.1 hypothetical protein C5Y93_18050 [Blastopirellula marina]
MTQLLVSVRNAEEADAALQGGADWIDVKEPSRGSLGAADPQVWREVVQTVSGAVPVSVALGEVADGDVSIPAEAFHGVAMAKYGLANLAAQTDWVSLARRAYQQIPTACAPVAVYYADAARANCPPLVDVIRFSQEVAASAILIDTHVKDGRTLFDFLSCDQLALAIAQIQQSGAMAACGGSLSINDLAKVAGAGADVLAVRGAACSGQRTDAVSLQRVRQLKATLHSFDGEA